MATIASRLSNTGTLLVNGSIDEVTFNTGTPAIKNIYKYTQDFTNAYWVGQGITVTKNQAIAPDGTFTANLATATGTFPTVALSPGRGTAVLPLSAGQVYVASIYVKYVNQTYYTIMTEATANVVSSGLITFNLLTGTIASTSAGNTSATGTITNVGNGWYRLSVKFTITVPGTGWNPHIVRIGSYDGTNYNGSQFYVWGAQLELTSTVTIYQGINGINTLVTPTFITKTVSDAIYSTGQFDEVTLTSGPAERKTNTGIHMVKGYFDEFTGAPVVDTSLIKWLDAGQITSLNSGTSTWNDLSGYSSHATLTSGTTYSSGNGGSIAANGTTAMNMASVATYPTTFADPWTAEVWIYIPSSVTWGTTNRTGIFQKGSYAGLHGLYLPITNNRIAVALRGTTGASSSSVGDIGRDAWYNVVGTWSGNTSGSRLNLYINGVLAQATTPTVIEAPSGTIWVIGSNTVEGAPGNYFNGNISAAKLYKRELTSDEVSQNFNALRRRYSV